MTENEHQYGVRRVNGTLWLAVTALAIGCLAYFLQNKTAGPRDGLAKSLTVYCAAGVRLAVEEAAKQLDNVVWAENAYDVADDADILVILTEWNEFRALNLDRIKDMMKTPRLLDLRNIYKLAEMESKGFVYQSIGRRPLDGESESNKKLKSVG